MDIDITTDQILKNGELDTNSIWTCSPAKNDSKRRAEPLGSNEVRMNRREEVMERLQTSVSTWNIEMAKNAAKEAIDVGITPVEAIERLGMGMAKISVKFDEGKVFLPQVLAASRSMEAAMKVFELTMRTGEIHMRGTIVLGTVQGDIHEIGKNVVAAMLKGAGYNVVDLGRDVPIDEFIDAALKHKADIVGASSLMTTTMIGQKQLVESLEEKGIKDSVKTIFGGAPCNIEWIESIGGDSYCPSGAEVVAVVDELMKK